MENIESGNRTNPSAENSVVKNKLRSAKKEGTTRGALISGIIALVILIASGIFVYSFIRKEQKEQLVQLENQRNTFTKEVNERDSVINDWLMTFDQIERDLSLIKQKENILTVESSGSEFSKDRRNQMLEDIQYLNKLLDDNKNKITSLSAQLKNSGGTIKGLQARVETLETTVKQYESDIAMLQETVTQKNLQIGELNTQMTALEETVSRKDKELGNQTLMLNEAFLTSGTFKELRDKGIVSKEGGFLGMGRTESLTGTINDTMFNKIDVREIRTIPINSKNAKLITEHPSDSYTMVPEGDNRIAYLEIKDPDQFWRISRYAVVELVK